MKKCTKCKILKTLSEYNKRRDSSDGFRNDCMDCDNQRRKKNHNTKDGLITRIFANQKKSSKKRNHQNPTYTKQELKHWLYSQKKFHIMYDNYQRLDNQSKYKPSVDRIDDSIGYTMSNIQLMTWGGNRAKWHNRNEEEA